MGIKRQKKIDKNNKKKIHNSKQNSKTIAIVLVVVVIAIAGTIGAFITTSTIDGIDNTNTNDNDKNPKLGEWMDVHGVGAISTEKNETTLYLATHNGLFKKINNNDNFSNWIEVGNDKSDLMGFTIDPDKKGVMYSSGHPQTGGNLGFRVSNDYGVTWQKVSDVTNPTPIDFHTMTTGDNPKIIYGVSSMGKPIYFSLDEGKTWNTVNSPDGERVVTLAANKTDSDIVYATTTNGLFSSTDQGITWQKVENALFGNQSQGNSRMVTGLEISSNGSTAYAFVAPNQDSDDEGGYIVKSEDGAKTWIKTDGQISGAQFVSKFAFSDNGKVYVVLIQDSENIGVASSVYGSNNGGKTWELEGTNNESIIS